MNSPPGQFVQAAGGTALAIPSAIISGINDALEKHAGLPHQYSQAVEMLAPAAKGLIPKAAPEVPPANPGAAEAGAAGTTGAGAGVTPPGSPPPAAPAEPVTVSPAYQNTADILLSKEGATPQSVLDAAGKMINADVPQTLPEVTGNANLLNRQRVIGEQANQAGQEFQDFNQSRLANEIPQAKEDLVNSVTKGKTPTMSDAGDKLRQVAQQIIDQAIQKRTDDVRPLYDQIKNQSLSFENLQSLRQNPLIEAEYQRVLKNDALMERKNTFDPQTGERKAVGGIGANSISAMDVVKKNLNGELQKYMEKDPGNKMVPLLTQSMQQVRDALTATNPIYGRANDEYAAASPEISALKDSGIGRIALSKTGENASKTIMNMSREQLADVLPKIQAVNPKAVEDLAATWLKEVTDQVSGKGLGAYIKQFSGDNKIVADKMQLLLGDDAYEAQQELITTLKNIQSGQPRNSETATKTETLKTMNKEGAGNYDTIESLTDIPTDKAAAIRRVLSWINDKKLVGGQKNQRELMQIFLNPDLEQLGAALRETADPTKRSDIIMQWLGEHIPDANRAGAAGASALPPKNAEEEAKQKLKKDSADDFLKPQVNNAAPDVSSFAAAESGNNPNAKNPNSTASGLFQFTNKTWADMVSKYGKETGITIKDKPDPKAQATMAQKLAVDNIASLKKTLGRLPTKGELYVAHVLGAKGAATLINAPQDREAIMLFPRQVLDANRSIFFKGKQPRTVAEVYNILTDKVA
jgi:hypothetical protein